MDETIQGPKHKMFRLPVQFQQLNFAVEIFFLLVIQDQCYGQNNSYKHQL